MRKNTTYLITGATGFIGAALTHRLAKRKNVKINLIVKASSKKWRLNDIINKVRIHHHDLQNLQSLKRIVKKIKPDFIFHFAAYGAYPAQDDIQKAVDTNIKGTINLVESCVQNKFKMLINVGSSSEYGFKKKPMKESNLLEPNSNYAVTKACGTLYCQYLAKQKKIPIITVRPFSVYGQFEEPTRLVPTLIYGCLNGKMPPLVSPKTARDFIYIEDFLDVCEKLANLVDFSGEIFNIGSGRQQTIRDVVSNVVKLTNFKGEIKWGSMPNRQWDSRCWVADVSKVKKALKWQPKYNLSQGLKASVKWFKEHQAMYQK